MEELKGYVEKIIYTNEENGHTILEVELSNDEVKRLRIIVKNMPMRYIIPWSVWEYLILSTQVHM